MSLIEQTRSPYYDSNNSQDLEMKCPYCKRKINRRVKRCICGMEFK